MAFKFPFTNYHELNLTWVLDQLKALFEKSEENITTIETYENRLTAVETELPSVSETASEASRAAAAAGSLAETAKTTADTAQNNAIQAQGLAGTARQEAQAAQTAANEATQAAQQAQATAQNFDGRITQAENDASRALEASRSFENRVQSAITTANNASQTATNAQGIAMRADQNAGAALDKIGDLSDLTTTAKQNLVAAINEAAQTGGSGDNSNCAPLIINTASGAIASFPDGADNRQIRKIVGTIVPQQAAGTPSPENHLPISGWTGANFIVSPTTDAADGETLSINWESEAGTIYGGAVTLNEDGSVDVVATKALKTYVGDSSEGWAYSSGWSNTATKVFYAANLPNSIYRTDSDNWIAGCNLFVGYSNNNLRNATYEGVCYSGNTGQTSQHYPTVRVLTSRATTVEDFKTFLSNNPLQFMYYLTNALTYHFDNIGQLKTFLGTNNVWCDTGAITECTYPADTKLYIDNKIAELQALILEN